MAPRCYTGPADDELLASVAGRVGESFSKMHALQLHAPVPQAARSPVARIRCGGGSARLSPTPARCHVAATSVERVDATDSAPSGALRSSSDAALDAQKAALLRLLATLDRGAAASASDRGAVEAAVCALEDCGRATSTGGPSALDEQKASLADRLSGKWRLAYSSTFAGVAGGSQGFTGPPGAGTPVRLGAVYQRIQPNNKKRLDNIVELRLPGLVPFTTSVPVTACLAHSLEFTGGDRVRIEFLELQFRLQGVRGLRPITLPSPVQALGLQAMLPLQLRGGEFDTTFCDADLRISRGDRGELRVFTRA